MRKSTITIILFAMGLIFGALVFGLWDVETSLLKASIVLVWTTIFLIALFYADKNERE
tara:strand:+ start:233 stop:406 length:174 start_codon:yes stop_codon:yes gene_type:complete